MIPKKIRRTLKHAGHTYEYCVTGRWAKGVFIRNIDTNKKLTKGNMWNGSFRPSDILNIIKEEKI